MWQVLLDSQSTCDVIVNEALVQNVRKCKWTLRLQTQAGDCKIDHVADMPGVGTVWFYADGIANILSQHRMATLSNWGIDYSTRVYRLSGDEADLSYNVTTSEGIKCRFHPTAEGLHVHEVDEHDASNAFGRRVIDNLTNRGRDMCHVGIKLA